VDISAVAHGLSISIEDRFAHTGNACCSSSRDAAIRAAFGKAILAAKAVIRYRHHEFKVMLGRCPALHYILESHYGKRHRGSSARHQHRDAAGR
jgi:hypothetical protein